MPTSPLRYFVCFVISTFCLALYAGAPEFSRCGPRLARIGAGAAMRQEARRCRKPAGEGPSGVREASSPGRLGSRAPGTSGAGGVRSPGGPARPRSPVASGSCLREGRTCQARAGRRMRHEQRLRDGRCCPAELRATPRCSRLPSSSPSTLPERQAARQTGCRGQNPIL